VLAKCLKPKAKYDLQKDVIWICFFVFEEKEEEVQQIWLATQQRSMFV